MTIEKVKYIHHAVKVIRGREAATIAKMKNAGWELESENKGTLRTDLTFRRVKEADGFDRLRAFFSKRWAAFRGLDPKIQKWSLGAVGGLVVILIVVASAVGGKGSGNTPAPLAAPVISTEAPVISTEAPSEDPAPSPTVQEPAEPEASEPEAEPYVYEGPDYEIITIDDESTGIFADQYWVLTEKFDTSTDAYQDQAKMIITDVARIAETDKLIVQVVTDAEIIQAESNETIVNFLDDKEMNYFRDVIAPKEATDWIAWYTGGFDPNEDETGVEELTFDIAWFVANENEVWRPDIGVVSAN